MPDPKSALLTRGGAVFDKDTGKIQVSAYLDLSKRFPDDCRTKHPDEDNPGLRAGESRPEGIKPWDDAWTGKVPANTKGRACGWIAKVPDSDRPQTVWFNTKITGSFRLSFLLATLQRQIWEDRVGKGKSNDLGRISYTRKASDEDKPGKASKAGKASKVSGSKSSSKSSSVKAENSLGGKAPGKAIKTKGGRAAAEKCADREHKKPKPKVDAKSVPREALLTYTGQSPPANYIAKRCQRLHGWTLGAALDTFKFTDKDGSKRGYLITDFRYDLTCGRLHVAGDMAAVGPKIKALITDAPKAPKAVGPKSKALDKRAQAREALGLPPVPPENFQVEEARAQAKIDGHLKITAAQTSKPLAKNAPATPQKAKITATQSPKSSAKAKATVTKATKDLRARSPRPKWAEALDEDRARRKAAAEAAAEEAAKEAAAVALAFAAAVPFVAAPLKRRLPQISSPVLPAPVIAVKRPRLRSPSPPPVPLAKEVAAGGTKRRPSGEKGRRLSAPCGEKEAPEIVPPGEPRADEVAQPPEPQAPEDAHAQEEMPEAAAASEHHVDESVAPANEAQDEKPEGAAPSEARLADSSGTPLVDAPPGHEAFDKIKFFAARNSYEVTASAVYGCSGAADTRRLQVSIPKAGGPEEAMRIARLLFARLADGATWDEARDFRNAELEKCTPAVVASVAVASAPASRRRSQKDEKPAAPAVLTVAVPLPPAMPTEEFEALVAMEHN